MRFANCFFNNKPHLHATQHNTHYASLLNTKFLESHSRVIHKFSCIRILYIDIQTSSASKIPFKKYSIIRFPSRSSKSFTIDRSHSFTTKSSSWNYRSVRRSVLFDSDLLSSTLYILDYWPSDRSKKKKKKKNNRASHLYCNNEF